MYATTGACDSGERTSSISSLTGSFGAPFTLCATFVISFVSLAEPSPPRPMTIPGREVLMRMRMACLVRSISTDVTYMPRRRFFKKLRMVVSIITFSRYCFGVPANQRDFQSRMTPRRCAYGCTVCVIKLFGCLLGARLLGGRLFLGFRVRFGLRGLLHECSYGTEFDLHDRHRAAH